MKIIHLPTDLSVCCLQANSFPQGVTQTYDALIRKLPPAGRSRYGISKPEGKQGEIVYRAATTRLSDEEDNGLEHFTIRKGPFLTMIVKDWREGDGRKVRDAFDQLLSDPRLDRQGYCLEEYVSDRLMRCMVPLTVGTVAADNARENVVTYFTAALDDFIKQVAAFDEAQLNDVLQPGQWSAGQVAEHVIKSLGTLPDNKTAPAHRFYDERVVFLKEMFLDFSIKYESPEFVVPQGTDHHKEELIQGLESTKHKLLQSIESADVTSLCLDMEFPTDVYLTRYEWLMFFAFHTLRHSHQLEGIHQALHTLS